MPLLRRRRPLLRAAAVGGGAYFAGKRHAQGMQREQQQDARLDAVEGQQYAQAPPPPPQQYAQAPAPPPAPAPAAGGMSEDTLSRLRELGQLHEQGVLTDEEFAAAKAKALGI